MTIRVVVADDHPLVRTGLQAALAPLPDVEVVAEAATGSDAIREAVLHRPDVVVMDLQMPDRNGIEATRELRRAVPSTAVLVLTTREREVLDLIAAGQNNHQIAERLTLSGKTVANHISAIFAKLQVADRTQAILRARDAGLGHPRGRGYPLPGPPRNTLATAPASAVSSAAAGGANKAAKGIRVGSVPVTITGSVMARMVASAQIPSVATDSPIQMGCHLELPRSRPIVHSTTRVPIPPQNHEPNAATGRCCCSEPETKSGAKTLIRSTAIQIPPIPIAVHSIQDGSAVVVWRSSRVGWSFIWCPSLASVPRPLPQGWHATRDHDIARVGEIHAPASL
jgi:DNA-binding CsgD family transcriptional regulator